MGADNGLVRGDTQPDQLVKSVAPPGVDPPGIPAAGSGTPMKLANPQLKQPFTITDPNRIYLPPDNYMNMINDQIRIVGSPLRAGRFYSEYEMQAQETAYYLRVFFEHPVDIFQYYPDNGPGETQGVAPDRYPLSSFLSFAQLQTDGQEMQWPVRGMGKTSDGIRLYSNDKVGLKAIAPHLEAKLRLMMNQPALKIHALVYKAEVDDYDEQADNKDDFPVPETRLGYGKTFNSTNVPSTGTAKSEETTASSAMGEPRSLDAEFKVVEEETQPQRSDKDIAFAHQNTLSQESEGGRIDAQAPTTPP